MDLGQHVPAKAGAVKRVAVLPFGLALSAALYAAGAAAETVTLLDQPIHVTQAIGPFDENGMAATTLIGDGASQVDIPTKLGKRSGLDLHRLTALADKHLDPDSRAEFERSLQHVVPGEAPEHWSAVWDEK